MLRDTDAPEKPHPPRDQVLARVLRHEIGDLLQTVYAASAILQDRMPKGGPERQLLIDLKTRAETCRLEIDAVVDLVCPSEVTPSLLDLMVLTGSLIDPLRIRFPRRVIQVTGEQRVVLADGQKLAHALSLLLRASCTLANQQVQVRLGMRDGMAEWALWRDGPPTGEETLQWLEQPFTITRHALIGLGLALTSRVVALHEGRFEVENLPQCGFEVRVLLPILQSETEG